MSGITNVTTTYDLEEDECIMHNEVSWTAPTAGWYKISACYHSGSDYVCHSLTNPFYISSGDLSGTMHVFGIRVGSPDWQVGYKKDISLLEDPYGAGNIVGTQQEITIEDCGVYNELEFFAKTCPVILTFDETEYSIDTGQSRVFTCSAGVPYNWSARHATSPGYSIPYGTVRLTFNFHISIPVVQNVASIECGDIDNSGEPPAEGQGHSNMGLIGLYVGAYEGSSIGGLTPNQINAMDVTGNHIVDNDDLVEVILCILSGDCILNCPEVCPTPVVTSVEWSPVVPNVGETVTFSAEADAGGADNYITSWYWEFGDGSTGFGQNVEHVYDRQGNFDVSLTLINDCNAWSEDYVDMITVTEPLGVVITICKGVEENCGLHRVEQIHSRELFTGGDRCAWLQHFCDFDCESVPWSITDTFDLSGFPVNYEIAVVHINAVGLMLNANYSFNVKWFDPDNVLISNITTDSFTGTYTLDEIDWIGYCQSEIYKNGDYRVEVDLLEDDFPVFQTIKQTFTITGITYPDPNCTFGVV